MERNNSSPNRFGSLDHPAMYVGDIFSAVSNSTGEGYRIEVIDVSVGPPILGGLAKKITSVVRLYAPDGQFEEVVSEALRFPNGFYSFSPGPRADRVQDYAKFPRDFKFSRERASRD